MVDKILSTKDKIEGERRNVTVLFADISGFTAMSEILDAEEVTNITNACFKLLVETIYKYEGTVDKFIGDGIMALFGAPISHENDPERAILTAIEMQDKVKKLSQEIKERAGIELRISIGINTGMVIAGNIGSDLRMEYTVMGDTVNTAARLQSIAEPGQILIGETTYKRVKDNFNIEELQEVAVKGKKEKIKVYQVHSIKQIWLAEEKRIARTRLIGRKKEFAHLVNCSNEILNNQGQVVAIVGEAGVGKSRLAYEDEDSENIKKEKIQKIIISLDENLKEIIPTIGYLLQVKFEELPTMMGVDQMKQMILYAIKRLILRASQNLPLIIEIEDMHWIDDATRELLNYLIDAIANSPILILCIYRPTFTHNWYNKNYYSQINLTPLNIDENKEQIKEILKVTYVPEELQEIIINKTEGNPFYTEELIKNLIESHVIEKTDDRIIINKDLSKLTIPDTVQGLIMARLDRLEEELKRVLQAASVIGRNFSYKLLKELTQEEIKLRESLSKLQNLEIIYEKQILPELEYFFKHVLTQEVTYNSILIKRRQEYHKRIAQIIEHLYKGKLPEYYELLAHHYSHSDDKEKAEEYLIKAGWKTHNLNSYDEAIEYYKKALELNPNNLKVIANLGWAYAHKGDYASAKRQFEIAKEKEPEGVYLYSCNLAGFYVRIKEFEKAEKIFKSLLDKSPARAYNGLAYLYTSMGEYAKAEEMIDKFSKLDINSETLRYSEAHFTSGYIREYIPEEEKGIDQAFIPEMKGVLYFNQRKFEEAIKEFEKFLEYYPKNVEIHFLLWCCYIELGDINKALKVAKKMFEIDKNRMRRLVPKAPLSPYPYWVLGFSYMLTGNKEEAIKLFNKGIELSPKDPVIHIFLGLVYLMHSEYEKVIEVYEKVEELKEGIDFIVADIGFSLKGTPFDEAQFYFNFAYSYHQLKQYEKAAEYYKKSLQLAPDHQEAKKNLAECEKCLNLEV